MVSVLKVAFQVFITAAVTLRVVAKDPSWVLFTSTYLTTVINVLLGTKVA
jgi:hypothetical protein